LSLFAKEKKEEEVGEIMKGKLLFLVCFLLIFKVFTENQQVITPPAGPFVKKGADVFITAEFLWWKAIQERLNYATTGVSVTPGTAVTSSGKIHTVGYPWKPGFRVGVGFYPCHDGWDLYARYTWLQSSSTDRAKSAGGAIVPISLTFNNLTTTQISAITAARSHWDLMFNVLDLELGRNFFLSRFLATRLFFGLRGSWIYQDWNTRYIANSVTLGNLGPLPGTGTTNQDHDSWGIGIRMGANATWIFYKGWSIVSDIAFAGLWNDYDVNRRDRLQIDGSPATTTVNISNDPNSIIANIEMMLGLKGEWWFQKERYHFSMQAGWESQIWIHYGRFISFWGQNNGDLTFNGLTAKLRFDF
jgi:hypothetical protein